MQTTSTADLSRSTSSTATAIAIASSTVSSSPRRPGDAVMARIPGWSRPYRAIINRVNADGTYDLTFPADGDKVNGVTEDVFVHENNNDNNNNNVQQQSSSTPPAAPSPTSARSRSPQQQEEEERQEYQYQQQQQQPTRPAATRTLQAGDRVEARAPGKTTTTNKANKHVKSSR